MGLNILIVLPHAVLYLCQWLPQILLEVSPWISHSDDSFHPAGHGVVCFLSQSHAQLLVPTAGEDAESLQRRAVLPQDLTFSWHLEGRNTVSP